MKLSVLDEPELEFGTGLRHIDPRFGIRHFGPADLTSATRPKAIRVGIVGSAASIEGLRSWLERCRTELPAKDSRYQNLFTSFPGFAPDSGFHSTLVFDSKLDRVIPQRTTDRLATLKPVTAVRQAVDSYLAEIQALADYDRCDVIICARPDTLLDDAREEPGDDNHEAAGTEDEEVAEQRLDFHDLLKAKAMQYPTPLQLVRRSTWDPSFIPAVGDSRRRPIQDEATRAWNLHTALYYKSGGVPWRLRRESTDLTACFVGVSFYQTVDAESLHTAVAQVFNERGDGVIVRGGQAKASKHDRQIHLSETDSHALLIDSLKTYHSEHHTYPAIVVIHKSSSFSEDEQRGFEAAAGELKLHALELIWLPDREKARVFRIGQFPPLRGTFLSLDERAHVLYTRGSVDFFRTYPGMYIPSPLGLRLASVERSAKQVAQEILALTKMNWNQTQLDGRVPITLRTAERVGKILKHVEPGVRPAPRYANYM